MNAESLHEVLIKRGLGLHNRFRYREALPFFKEAWRISPKCPAAIYNLANTLHMTDQPRKACQLLFDLIGMNHSALAEGCPTLRQPKGFRTDAYFLLFHVLISWKGSWEAAYPYAQKHLRQRQRGVKSAWTLAAVRRDITELRRSARCAA